MVKGLMIRLPNTIDEFQGRTIKGTLIEKITNDEEKIWKCCICGKALNYRQIYVNGRLEIFCFNDNPDRAILMEDFGTPNKFLRRITIE